MNWTSITGASSGIGKSYSLLAAEEGRRLVLSGRDEDRLQETKLACLTAGASDVKTIICDYSNLDDIEKFIQFHQEVGPIERFVSCAGFGRFANVLEHDKAHMQKMLQVNLIATMLIVKEMALLMLNQNLDHGEIGVITSVAGKIFTSKSGFYAASKAGLHGFCKALAQDLWDTPITVTSILPGPTDTAFFNHEANGQAYFEHVKQFATTPEKVAKKMHKALAKGRTEITVPAYYEGIYRLIQLFPETGAKVIHSFYALGNYR